jgi:hypothetical protein
MFYRIPCRSLLTIFKYAPVFLLFSLSPATNSLPEVSQKLIISIHIKFLNKEHEVIGEVERYTIRKEKVKRKNEVT